MLDLKFVLANLEQVERAVVDKNAANEHTQVKKLPKLEEQRKQAIFEAEQMKAEKNKLSKEIGVKMGQSKALLQDPSAFTAMNAEIGTLQKRSKALNDRIQELEQLQTKWEAERDEILAWLPNVPHSSTPDGATDDDNQVLRVEGDSPEFDFAPKPHYELGAELRLLDTDRGAKVAGSGWYFLRGDGARMERALINWFLDTHRVRHGYEELFPPFFVTQKTLYGSGQYPKFQEQMYYSDMDRLYAIPTAEVPVTAFHRDEILEEKDLPKKYVAYSACFRREAGAAGAETRGILRVHQFNKVELLKLTTPQTSYAEHDSMLKDAEYLLKELGLYYRVVLVCRGAMGFSGAKQYDLEVYAPGAQRWLEVSSITNFEDFQARRSNLRYRPTEGGKPQYVHTLNGSGLALPRILVALWESNQRSDGTLVLPAVLRKYMDGQSEIKKENF
ncbi:MAG: serine--tRNA ligase [Planctomycetota bacterium]